MKLPKQIEPVVRIPAPVRGATGLGDVIERATGAVGIKACKRCQRRAAALNRWIGFKPIGERS